MGSEDNVCVNVRAHTHTHTYIWALESDPIISCAFYVLGWAGFVFCLDGFWRI